MTEDVKENKRQKEIGSSGKFDPSELILPVLIFAIISPFIGLLTVKIFNFNFDRLGTYGDFLGGSTIPFLTMVTILFIYRTYNLQQQQLKTQQIELESTRETLQEQSKTAKMQRFENTFFIQLDELRKCKISIEEYYRVNGLDVSFTEYILSLRKIFDKRVEFFLNNSKDILTYEHNKEEFFKQYGQILSNALDDSGVYQEKKLQIFFSGIKRTLQLIFEYKKSMNDWEMNFYLNYLNDEISKEAINIILLDICFNKALIAITSDLKLDRFADRNYKNARRKDFDFIKYVLYENPNLDI